MKFHLFFALGIALCFVSGTEFVCANGKKQKSHENCPNISIYVWGSAVQWESSRCGRGSGEQLAAVGNPAHRWMSSLQQMEANFISVVFGMKTLVPTPALLKMKWEWMRTYLHFS